MTRRQRKVIDGPCRGTEIGTRKGSLSGPWFSFFLMFFGMIVRVFLSGSSTVF